MEQYKIANWNDYFENSKSRERDACSWCPIPNKQDGLGYGLIMEEDDGAAIYGAFVAVVLMCSKQRKSRDGHLTDTGRAQGRPLTERELSIKTRVPADVIKRMIDVTSSNLIGWLEVVGVSSDISDNNESSASQVPAECPSGALEEKRREGKRREVEEEGEGEKISFFRLINDLKKDAKIENAISAIYASHDAFGAVNRMYIENTLKSYPDKTKWAEAIEGMAAAYAGAKMERPNRTLNNWLAGKVEKNGNNRNSVSLSRNKDDFVL